METSEYELIELGFFLLTGICVFLFFFGLKKALNKSEYSESKRSKVFYGTLLVIGLWLALISILSLTGVTSNFNAFPPTLVYFLFPPLLLIIYIVFSGKVDKILKAVPQTWLLSFHALRIVVELLLWRLFVVNVIPIQMTFEGRNFDIIGGILGIIVAYAYSKRKLSNTVLATYNIVGLLLLLNIVVIAVLSMPIPLRVFMNEPANTVIAYFPVIFLPTVLVPFVYTFHFFSLRKLVLK